MASSDNEFGRESQHAVHATTSRFIMSLDEEKHRFHSSHQLQVRTYLYKARGKYWGKDVKMTGLNDVFAFVCKGLGCSDAEIMTARTRLYRSLMTEYTGQDYEKKTPLTDGDFQNVFPHLTLPNVFSCLLLIDCNFGWMPLIRRPTLKAALISAMEEEISRGGLRASRI
jgi:hypothetical protein